MPIATSVPPRVEVSSVPPRVEPQRGDTDNASKETREAGKQFWNAMDDMFQRTMINAQQAYKTNRMINIVVVAVGVILIGNSIAYGWYKQSADAFALFLGGLGLATFISVFFLRPQSAIEQALGRLAQIQMIYKAHSAEYEAISDYDWEKFSKGNHGLTDIISMNQELDRVTDKYTSMVQKYFESGDNNTQNRDSDSPGKPHSNVSASQAPYQGP